MLSEEGGYAAFLVGAILAILGVATGFSPLVVIGGVLVVLGGARLLDL